MRRLLVLIPALVWAQNPAAPPAAPKPAAKTAATSSAAKKTAPAPKTAPKPMTDEEKTIYALGLSMYRSLTQFDLSPAELDIVKKSLTDAAAGKPAVDIQTWGPKIQDLATKRGAQALTKQKTASTTYLAKAASQTGAQKSPSGLIYRELVAGKGASPKATDTVKVNYKGDLIDGTEFDSSYKRGEPAQFPLSNVIKCWTEGVQKMKVGGKAQLVCPADIAYGDSGRPGIPGGATLVFEIELLEIGGAPAAK